MSAQFPGLPPVTLARIAELAEKLRDDTIDDAEVAELESLLAESAAAREAFAGLAMIAAELRHAQGRRAWAQRPESLFTRGRANGRRWLAPLTAAAGLAVLVLLGWIYSRWHPDMHPGPITTISNASGVVLLADGRAAKAVVGTTLHPEELQLQSGLLELTYPSGVVLVLESPARFNLRNATTVLLSEGNLSARVPEGAKGFTVETPSARIVDLGTEFGVSAGAASSEVHVFQGEVIVKTPDEPDPLRLTTSRASRIDTQTQTPAGIDFRPERFFRTLDEPSNRYVELIRQWDPVAYYRMNITPEASQLVDLSPRQLHATIIRGTSQCASVPGKIGAGLRLGGPVTRSFAVVPDFPRATTTALTVCAWVRAESRPRWATIAKNWAKDMGRNHGGQFHFGLFDDEGGLEVHVHDGRGAEVGVREDQPLPLGEWQFVAFTLDDHSLRLFRNGREVGHTPCVGLSQFAPPALGIGVKLDASGRKPEVNTAGFWDGALDELAIFHRPLGPDEILRLYEAAR